MKNENFPTYSVSHLKEKFFVNMDKELVEIEKIGLEQISLLSKTKLVEEGNVNLMVTFGTTEININGDILHFLYERDSKMYRYIVSTYFEDKKSFLKWMAIIKGLHKARFKA